MDIRFAASQGVEMAVPEQPVHIANYLRHPQRVVLALAASSKIEQLRDDLYRLHMRPLHFMTLSICPVVDLRVWSDEAGRVQIRSTGCELRGIEGISQQFQFDLQGHLYPMQRYGETVLKGEANLAIAVILPPPFSLTPRRLLETTGNRLLASVLSSVKQRLFQQLLADYRRWSIAPATPVHPALHSGLQPSVSPEPTS